MNLVNVSNLVAIKKLCHIRITHEHVSMGVCCMQDAIDVLKTEEDKQKQFLDNIETWDCVLGKGKNDQMFDSEIFEYLL